MLSDAARAKATWPVLGRPGAVLHHDEIVGIWRPRKAGGGLTVRVELWIQPTAALRDAITEQAGQLAGHRQVRLTGIGFA